MLRSPSSGAQILAVKWRGQTWACAVFSFIAVNSRHKRQCRRAGVSVNHLALALDEFAMRQNGLSPIRFAPSITLRSALLAAARKKAESVPPSAADLIESLRDFGYTLPSALADLIDNTVTARASTIQVAVDASMPEPHVPVVDDGDGMEEGGLVELHDSSFWRANPLFVFDPRLSTGSGHAPQTPNVR